MVQYTNSDYKEIDDEISINIRNVFLSLFNNKKFALAVFLVTFLIFVVFAFVLPKKYLISADLYIKKSNNSNLLEINPYVIDQLGSNSAMGNLFGGSENLSNEIELILSPLVIEKVIKENDLRYKKLFGIYTTRKTGEYLNPEKFIKKIAIENKKGTNVISIEYKNRDKILAYNVVNSIIKNYEELLKQINTEKAKSDIKILENEYAQAKANLNSKIESSHGLPANAISGIGNVAAMSAFSQPARKALSQIQSQYMAGGKSQIEIQEESTKVAQLASKLEWAKLVNQMSDSSKVIVIKEPKLPKDYEYVSPKLIINIILGLIFGFFLALISVYLKEKTNKKLSYLMLDDSVIYNINNEMDKLKTIMLNNNSINFVYFDDMPKNFIEAIKIIDNITYTRADISKAFIKAISDTDYIILVSKINKTDADKYKYIKNMIKNIDKKILVEVLL